MVMEGGDELTVQVELGVSGVERLLAVVQTALNAFPLFEVLLRIKEPSRLPGQSRPLSELSAHSRYDDHAECCVLTGQMVYTLRWKSPRLSLRARPHQERYAYM